MGVHVTGADELSAAFTKTADDLGSLDVDAVATEAASVLRGFIPVASGRARNTIRPVRAEGRAVVTMGGPSAPYVSILRSTHPSRFVQRADDVMERRAPDLMEKAWDDLAQRNGLT